MDGIKQCSGTWTRRKGTERGGYIGRDMIYVHGYTHTHLHTHAFLPLVMLMFEACLLSNVHCASEESIVGINAEEFEKVSIGMS